MTVTRSRIRLRVALAIAMLGMSASGRAIAQEQPTPSTDIKTLFREVEKYLQPYSPHLESDDIEATVTAIKRNGFSAIRVRRTRELTTRSYNERESTSFLYIVDPVSRQFRAFRLTDDPAGDANRIRRHIESLGQRASVDEIRKQLVALDAQRKLHRTDMALQPVEVLVRNEPLGADSLKGGPKAEGAAALQSYYGCAVYTWVTSFDPVWVPLARTGAAFTVTNQWGWDWDFNPPECWNVGLTGISWWEEVSCIEDPQIYNDGGEDGIPTYDYSVWGEYIDWLFGDPFESTTIWQQAAANWNRGHLSTDTFALSMGDFESWLWFIADEENTGMCDWWP